MTPVGVVTGTVPLTIVVTGTVPPTTPGKMALRYRERKRKTKNT
jgi:hypothetical protein